MTGFLEQNLPFAHVDGSFRYVSEFLRVSELAAAGVASRRTSPGTVVKVAAWGSATPGSAESAPAK